MANDIELSGAEREKAQTLGQRVERRAARYDGILTTAQLHVLGLTDSRIRRWVAAGRLFPQHRGVFSVGRAESSPAGRRRAALEAIGTPAWLSHVSAAAHWGWRRDDDEAVHVTTTRRGLRQHKGIRIHGAEVAPPGLLLNGLRVTTPARTIADMAASTTEEQLLALCSTAAFNGGCSRRDILGELVPGRPGVGTLRAVLATLDIGDGVTRSELEHAFRRLIERHRITPPSFNHAFNIGGRTIVADAAWLDRGFIVELDSRLAHGTDVALFNDGEKDLLYEELGLDCLRLTWRHVVGDEERTARALARRVGRA